MQNRWTLAVMVATSVVALAAAQTSADPQIVRARALLAARAALPMEDLHVIREAVRAALAGRYTVRQIRGGVSAEADQGREDEFLFDARGRVRFHRFSQIDPVRPGKRLQTILEFTDLPAVRCSDGSTYSNRRLAVTYSEDRNGWGIRNPQAVEENSSPDFSTVHALLSMADAVFTDAGARTIDGRHARGLTRKAPTGPMSVESTLWIDAQSLLPLVDTTVAVLEGQCAEVSVTWRYPPPRAITRPPGLAPPACI